MKTFLRFLFLVSILSSTKVFSAAPTITYLYPTSAQQGKSVDVTVGGSFDPKTTQIWTSHRALRATISEEKDKITITALQGIDPGIYWLRLFNAEGPSVLRPFVVGQRPELQEIEPNDDFKKPQALSDININLHGRLQKRGDVDHFSLSLTKGQTLIASMQANEVLGSPMDAHIQIVSPDGFVLKENNDTNGLDPQVDFLVPKDGKYLVRIFAFPASPDSTIGFAGGESYIYRLTLTTEGYADHVFPSAISRNDSQPIEIRGWNLSNATKKIQLRTDQITGRFPFHHPEFVNPISLRIEPHPCIREIEPNDRNKPQVVSFPITISGHIEDKDDIDVFEWSAKKDQRCLVQIESDSLNSPLDCTLRIMDSQGKTIAEIDDQDKKPDPILDFSVTKEGTFRAEVRDLYRHGGWRYHYRLRILLIEPDFRIATPANPNPIDEGGTLEIPIAIERMNGFATPVDFRIEGLPEKIKATFDPSNGKGDKLKLRIAPTIPFSGPIRVIAYPVNKKDQDRVLKLPIPNFKETIDHLWITIRSPAAKK